MAAHLPAQRVARLQNRIPGVHRCSDISIAHAGVALHIEPGRAKSALSAKTNSGNSQLGNNVVREAVLGSTVHRQPRNRYVGHVHNGRTDDAIPADRAILREVVVKGAETGQVLGHETFFAARGISRENAVATF